MAGIYIVSIDFVKVTFYINKGVFYFTSISYNINILKQTNVYWSNKTDETDKWISFFCCKFWYLNLFIKKQPNLLGKIRYMYITVNFLYLSVAAPKWIQVLSLVNFVQRTSPAPVT